MNRPRTLYVEASTTCSICGGSGKGATETGRCGPCYGRGRHMYWRRATGAEVEANRRLTETAETPPTGHSPRSRDEH